MPEKKYNMDLYDEALVKIHPDDRRTLFPMRVIGRLSSIVPQDIWEEVLDQCVNASKKPDKPEVVIFKLTIKKPKKKE